mgnify:CR=1 FL=1
MSISPVDASVPASPLRHSRHSSFRGESAVYHQKQGESAVYQQGESEHMDTEVVHSKHSHRAVRQGLALTLEGPPSRSWRHWM